jgi:hypothetical protein
MPRKVKVKKVARLQTKYLRSEGATAEEIRRFRPYLTAQIGQESGFTQGIGSPAGAQDIAQFMPATAPGYGVTLGDNKIRDDIRGQVRYMLPLLRRYGVEDALRGYNAGVGAIARSHGFSETNNYVANIKAAASKYELPNLGRGFRNPSAVGSNDPGVAPTGTPPGEATDAKGAMIAALMDPRKGMSLLSRFNERVDSGQYTTLTPGSINGGAPPKYVDPVKGVGHGQPGSPTGAYGQQALVQQANKIDKAQVPYLWGGGHGGKQSPNSRVTPLDCSGAVSRLLGINPMVAAQFKSWGKAGRDPKGRLTIWANNGHVLAEVGGHFWGTSRANPGGGAGWIPRSQISASYLAGFTPRHQ